MGNSFRHQPVTPLNASRTSAAGGFILDLHQQVNEMVRSMPRFRRAALARRLDPVRADAIEQVARRKTQLLLDAEITLFAETLDASVQQALLRKLRADSQLHVLANMVFSEEVHALFQLEGKTQENADAESDVQHDAVEARLAAGRISAAEVQKRHAAIDDRAARVVAAVSDNSAPMEEALRQRVRETLERALTRF